MIRPQARQKERLRLFWRAWLLALIGLTVWLLLASGAARAQSTGWTPPLNLFETTGRASEAEVVTDAFGVVHVFWAYSAPGNGATDSWQGIYYARKQGDQWSDPVNILVSPEEREARMEAAVADRDGYLHVVWSGGDAIFYSWAYAPGAGTAKSWTPPEALITGVAALEPAIAADEQGGLYVVWTQAGAGLMFVQSQDGGQTWSTPQAIFRAGGDNQLVRWGRIATDQAGRLHVAFTLTANDETRAQGRPDPYNLYYLRSSDYGVTWSDPLQITPEPDFGEVNVATFGRDTVHLVWNGRADRKGRYHRWSQDGGATWSNIIQVLAPAPRNPIGDGGLTGFPALAVDAVGVLHMVSATGGGDYYFRWKDGKWSAPILISPGLSGWGVTGSQNSLEQPSLAILGGNQLQAVFHDGFERIWYTSTPIDAPRQSAMIPPLRVAPGTAAPPTPEATASAKPLPLSRRLSADDPPGGQAVTSAPLFASVLSVLLVIGGVVLIYQVRRRR